MALASTQSNEERLAKIRRKREEHPSCVPVVVTCYTKETDQAVETLQLIVKRDYTVAQLKQEVRGKLKFKVNPDVFQDAVLQAGVDWKVTAEQLHSVTMEDLDARCCSESQPAVPMSLFLEDLTCLAAASPSPQLATTCSATSPQQAGSCPEQPEKAAAADPGQTSTGPEQQRPNSAATLEARVLQCTEEVQGSAACSAGTTTSPTSGTQSEQIVSSTASSEELAASKEEDGGDPACVKTFPLDAEEERDEKVDDVMGDFDTYCEQQRLQTKTSSEILKLLEKHPTYVPVQCSDESVAPPRIWRKVVPGSWTIRSLKAQLHEYFQKTPSSEQQQPQQLALPILKVGRMLLGPDDLELKDAYKTYMSSNKILYVKVSFGGGEEQPGALDEEEQALQEALKKSRAKEAELSALRACGAAALRAAEAEAESSDLQLELEQARLDSELEAQQMEQQNARQAAHLQEVIDQVEAQKELLEAKDQQGERECEQLRQEVGVLKQQLAAKSAECEELHATAAEAESLRQELAQVRKELEAANQSAKDLSKYVRMYRESLDNKIVELEESTAKVKELEAELKKRVCQREDDKSD